MNGQCEMRNTFIKLSKNVNEFCMIWKTKKSVSISHSNIHFANGGAYLSSVEILFV